MFLTCYPHANDARAGGFASGGKISPAQRQIGGDREQLEGRKSQPGACCHLSVSSCSEVTFLLYRLSSPRLCHCCPKLMYRRKHGDLDVIARTGGLFPTINLEPHSICHWIVLPPQSERLGVGGGYRKCSENSGPDELSVGQARYFFLESQGQQRSSAPRERGLT